MVVSGTGDMQLDVLVSRLKSRFGVDAELIRARVALPGEDPQEGGGPGPPQEADRRPRPVRRRVDPLRAQDEQEDMDLLPRRSSAAPCPKNFFPAVEKGLREAVTKGVLAGYPGGRPEGHPVRRLLSPGGLQRNGLQDRRAAGLQRAGCPTPYPTLLEPIGELKVTIPDSYHGRRHGRPEQAPGPGHGHEPRPTTAIRFWRPRSPWRR